MVSSFKRKESSENHETWGFVSSFVDKYFWSIKFLSVFVFLSRSLSILSAILFLIIIDSIFSYSDPSLFLKLGLISFLVTALSIYSSLVIEWASNIRMRNIINEAALALYEKICRFPIGKIENYTSNELLARMPEISKLVSHQYYMRAYLWQDILFCIIILIIMCLISWQITLILACILPLFFISNIFFSRHTRYLTGEIYEDDLEVGNFVVQSIENIELMKSFGAEARSVKLLASKYSSHSSIVIQKNLWAALHSRVNSSLTEGLTVLVLMAGGLFFLQGSVSLGGLFALRILIGQIRQPMMRLIGLRQASKLVNISATNMSDIILSKDEAEIRPCVKSTNNSFHDHSLGIRIQNLSYKHPDETGLFQGTDIYFPRDTLSQLKAPSGQGKSTLAKTIVRLKEHADGEIFIDGVNLKAIRTDRLRETVLYVPQSSNMWSGDIGSYLHFLGADNVSEESDLHFLINDFDLSRKFATLSGGQRQRLLIYAALSSQASYIILDETTSAIDFHFERNLLTLFQEKLHNKTIVLISHREYSSDIIENVVTL